MTRIAESCKVDHFSPILAEGGKDDETRPDLVFLMSDTVLAGPYTLLVVELKSPSKPLHVDHYRQLEDYIFKVRAWCETHVDHAVAVTGYLIGTFPLKATTVPGESQLLEKWKKSGPKDEIKIFDVMRLIDDARQTHLEAIKALEQETGDGDDEEVADEAEIAIPPTPDGSPPVDEARK